MVTVEAVEAFYPFAHPILAADAGDMVTMEPVETPSSI